MSDENVIYALCDPDTEEVRYVGKTKHLEQRVKEHLGKHKGPSFSKLWTTELAKDGKAPAVKVLEKCDEVSASERELHWIRLLQETGAQLLNREVAGSLRAAGIDAHPSPPKHPRNQANSVLTLPASAGQRVKFARELAGLTQVELAQRVGAESRTHTISEIEMGRRPLGRRAAAIAAACNTTADFLVGLTDDPAPSPAGLAAEVAALSEEWRAAVEQIIRLAAKSNP